MSYVLYVSLGVARCCLSLAAAEIDHVDVTKYVLVYELNLDVIHIDVRFSESACDTCVVRSAMRPRLRLWLAYGQMTQASSPVMDFLKPALGRFGIPRSKNLSAHILHYFRPIQASRAFRATFNDIFLFITLQALRTPQICIKALFAFLAGRPLSRIELLSVDDAAAVLLRVDIILFV
eukprot:706885-Pleurochrysis_carterae.AAC.1